MHIVAFAYHLEAGGDERAQTEQNIEVEGMQAEHPKSYWGQYEVDLW